jgi:hypothetical protein
VPVILDQHPQNPPSYLTDHSTIGDYLKWARTLLPSGQTIIKIQLDDQLLEGTALTRARRDSLGKSTLSLTSTNQKELALTMLGKLAALIEWLSPQHRDVAGLLERGNTQAGLQRLQGILSAWQQIQSAYSNLAKMLGITLKDLPVHELNGEAVLNEFCRQLAEIQTALQNSDFVLLADILQYEMDGAIANWMSLLEATLGIVEPVGTN